MTRIKITDEKCPNCGGTLRPAGSYRTKDSIYQRYSCPLCMKKFTDEEPYASCEFNGTNLIVSCHRCGFVWMPMIKHGGVWGRNSLQCSKCREMDGMFAR